MSKEPDIIIIKPVSPIIWVAFALFFGVMSILLLTSPYLDFVMTFLGVFMLIACILSFFFIDYSFLRIHISGKVVELTGCFNFRKITLKREEIRGYQIKERYDNHNGVHRAFQVVSKSGKTFFFPKIAYNNYDQLGRILESHFKYLGTIELSNAKFYKRWMPMLTLLSGLIALIVAILKYVS